MKLKIKDVNNMDALIKDIDLLSGKKVRAGIFDTGEKSKVRKSDGKIVTDDEVTVFQKAHRNEYGIGVPERSYIRAGYDTHKDEFGKKAEVVVKEAIKRGIDPDAALDAMGIEMRGVIRQFLTDLTDPPNSPETIRRKKSSNPLIDTGQLRSAIDYEVE